MDEPNRSATSFRCSTTGQAVISIQLSLETQSCCSCVELRFGSEDVPYHWLFHSCLFRRNRCCATALGHLGCAGPGNPHGSVDCADGRHKSEWSWSSRNCPAPLSRRRNCTANG